MKPIHRIRALLASLAVGVSLLIAASAHAATTYHVNLNGLGSLPTLSSGNYSLDLSFLDGDGTLGSNAISVGNFSFTGGSALGSSTITGGATGSLAGTVHFDNASAFQDLYQAFSAGTSNISFDVTTTTNGSLTPDNFAVTLLDDSLNTITSNAPDGFSLFTQPIDLALASGAGFTGSSPFAGTGSFAGVSVDSVPEPSRAVLLAGAFGALLMRRRRARA